jgi:hypothetical protein
VAEAADLSIPRVKRAESGGPIKVAEDTVAAITKALEKAGVDFIAEWRRCRRSNIEKINEEKQRTLQGVECPFSSATVW